MKFLWILALSISPVLAAAPLLAKEKPAEPPAEKPTGPQPKLVMASLEHDFGNLQPGTPLEYRFELENRGKADLLIEKVKAACGCTTSSYDSLVAPGKNGGITLTIKNTRSYRGAMTKTATVTTNDPEQPTLKLVLRAMFEDPAAQDPAKKPSGDSSKPS